MRFSGVNQPKCNTQEAFHALSVVEANVFDQIDLGTHTIFVGDVVNSEVIKDGRPLTYRDYHENLKGKSPPNAPTYSGT
jgi:ferric-chelate reductase [NAD(P)H]